jgi:hypothetical protein
MKKLIVASALLLASTAANAALTDTLILRGTIAPTCSLKVTADPAATALDLTSAAALKVGSLNVICNNAKGYSVTAASTTAGKLIETTNGTSAVPYQVTIVGVSGVGAVQPTIAGIQIASNGTTSAPINRTSDINFNTMTNSNSMAGTFQDTVTFTLSTP